MILWILLAIFLADMCLLHKEIGLNLDSRLGLTSFGIQVRKVLLAPHLTSFLDILHVRKKPRSVARILSKILETWAEGLLPLLIYFKKIICLFVCLIMEFTFIKIESCACLLVLPSSVNRLSNLLAHFGFLLHWAKHPQSIQSNLFIGIQLPLLDPYQYGISILTFRFYLCPFLDRGMSASFPREIEGIVLFHRKSL